MESKFGRKNFPIIIVGENRVGKTKLAEELSLNPIFKDVNIYSSQEEVVIEQGNASIVILRKNNYEEVKELLIDLYDYKDRTKETDASPE